MSSSTKKSQHRSAIASPARALILAAALALLMSGRSSIAAAGELPESGSRSYPLSAEPEKKPQADKNPSDDASVEKAERSTEATGASDTATIDATAAKVLDAYVEAIGGKKAWAKINNRRISGIYEIASRGVQFTMTITEARPAKRHTLFVQEVPQPPFEVGTNGKESWSKFGFQPAADQGGSENELTIEFARFDRYVDWRTYFTKVRHAGQAEVDGKMCDKIVMTPRLGQPETRYFDTASHLAIKSEEIFAAGDTPQITIFQDYKEVDGIKYPHLLRVDFKGDLRHKLINGIEHNVNLPADEFDKPPYPDPRYPMEYQPDVDTTPATD